MDGNPLQRSSVQPSPELTSPLTDTGSAGAVSEASTPSLSQQGQPQPPAAASQLLVLRAAGSPPEGANNGGIPGMMGPLSRDGEQYCSKGVHFMVHSRGA